VKNIIENETEDKLSLVGPSLEKNPALKKLGNFSRRWRPKLNLARRPNTSANKYSFNMENSEGKVKYAPY
jgi:hypothetical protein